MCLIVKQTAAKPLTDTEVREVYRRNADGFGVAWYDTDARVVKYWRRVPDNANDAVALYRHALGHATEDRPIVAHWRMATGGVKTDDMCHPFPVPHAGAVLIHNGVMADWQARAVGGQSDTAALAAYLDGVAAGLAPETARDLWTSDTFREWASRQFAGQRIVVVGYDGQIHHYGSDGIEHEGRWLSNTYAGPSSLYPRPTYAPTGYAGWRGWHSHMWEDVTPPYGTRTASAANDNRQGTLIAMPRRRRSMGVYLPDAITIDRPRVLAYGPIVDVAAWVMGHDDLAPYVGQIAGACLASDDVPTMRYGLGDVADTLNEVLRPVRLAVRVSDLVGDRVTIRVVDVDDKPRAEVK
jgi:hypothetical protein